MTKRKLKNTKNILFVYNPDKTIRALKDENVNGQTCNIKSAYDLIVTISNHYQKINVDYKPIQEELWAYMFDKMKPLSPITKYIKNPENLEILTNN